MPPSGVTRIHWWTAFGLIIFTAVVFAPVVGFEFLPWDDPHYVYENPKVAAGLTGDSVRWALTAGSPYWHPVTWMSHMADVELFGMSPAGHHGMAVLLHALSAALLFLFLHRTTGSLLASLVVGALFAIHPMRVESVAWVAERKDILATLALMLVLHAYVSYVRRPSVGRYVIVTVLYVIGLMSKPVLITVPALLLLVDIWPLRRWAGNSATGTGLTHLDLPHLTFKQMLAEKVPWALLSIGTVVLVMSVQVQPIASLESIPLGLRFVNALTFYATYPVMTVWPTDLTPLHPVPRVMPSWFVVVASLAALTTASVIAIRLFARRPFVTVGWFWYVASLVPLVGLIQAGDQGVADRFAYIPGIGLYVIAAWTGAELARRGPKHRTAVAIVAAAVVAACVFATRSYLPAWRDGVSLWSHAVGQNPDNHRAQANLGNALSNQGRTSSSVAAFRRAVSLAPDVLEYRRFLGRALAQGGLVPDAVVEFEAVLKVNPLDARTRGELGLALARSGRWQEAVDQHSEAVRLTPESAAAHANLCIALGQVGRHDAGIRHCRESIRLDPNIPKARSHLAVLYLAQGNVVAAIAEFRIAAQLAPYSTEHLVNLATALTRNSEFTAAREQLDRALSLEPTSAEAHNSLGVLLSQQGRNGAAIDAFSRALVLKPTLLDAYSNRARALAIAGNIDAAIADFESILQLVPNHPQARQAIEHLRALKVP